MRTFRLVFVLIAIVMFSSAGRASFRPSFGGGSKAWRSTDIVLVSTLPAEGTFQVIETWKGSLYAGERIVVPQLIPEPNSLPISRYPTSLTDALRDSFAEQIPREPGSSHMVLFEESLPGLLEDPENWEENYGEAQTCRSGNAQVVIDECAVTHSRSCFLHSAHLLLRVRCL